MIPRFDPEDTEAALKLIEDMTSDGKQIQEKVLEDILTQNVNTEYLRQFLNGRIDKQSFKTRVPVVTYEDVKPYITRVASGEQSEIICSQRITDLHLSTGTSGGEQKALPSTAEDVGRWKTLGKLLVAILNKHIVGTDRGKGMMFMFARSEAITHSGLSAAPVTSRFFKTRTTRNGPSSWYNSYTSPEGVVLCLDGKQSLYCQLICGLLQNDEVLRVGANFACTFIRAISFLEQNWRELCSNIRRGHLSDWITDTNCKRAMATILLSPNPELADTIEHECGQKSWEGIIRRLWPRTKLIQTIATGSMAHYVPLLEFYSGGLPIVSTIYGSSEGRFGINLEPLSKPCDVAYTLLPFVAYFEFSPVDGDEDQLVDLGDVKVGHSYELVVTNFCGLYRYRMGDILMVKRFHNNTPQFRFVQRKGSLLSIDMEKISEDDLFKGVMSAKERLEPLELLLIDYTSYTDFSSTPGHYVIFWELIRKDGKHMSTIDHEVMEDCCSVMEEFFHSPYKSYWKKEVNSIGPLEIRVVKQGTFNALMDFVVSRGASVNQYKTPRGIKSEEVLKLLDSKVMAKFFSQKVPS